MRRPAFRGRQKGRAGDRCGRRAKKRPREMGIRRSGFPADFFTTAGRGLSGGQKRCWMSVSVPFREEGVTRAISGSFSFGAYPYADNRMRGTSSRCPSGDS